MCDFLTRRNPSDFFFFFCASNSSMNIITSNVIKNAKKITSKIPDRFVSLKAGICLKRQWNTMRRLAGLCFRSLFRPGVWYPKSHYRDLEILSLLADPKTSLIVAEILLEQPASGFSPAILYLEDVQDPGNVGTMTNSRCSRLWWSCYRLRYSLKTLRSMQGSFPYSYLKLIEKNTGSELRTLI